MHPNLVVLFLSLFLGSQPITTDLYLPALPTITEGFGASMHQAQLTLTALLLAFGVSQLVWGPMSDKYGRRPVLIIGMAAYTAAAFGSVFAANMEALIGWRILQGIAMGAVVTCARAMTRDLFAPTEGAKIMSKGLSGLGVIACISAPLGGALSDWLGWRASMMALAIFGLITLVLTILKFKETLQTPNPQALHPNRMLSTWKMIASNSTFWAFAILSTASYGGLFTFLATSSFVFIKVLGLSKTEFGLVMFSNSLAYIIGTFICRRMLAHWGVVRTVRAGGFFTFIAGVSIALLTWLGMQSVWSLMLPIYVFMLGHGVNQACGQSGSAGPFPQAAGAAVALAGFVMMLFAFANGLWIGWALDGTVRPLAYGVAAWSVLIVLTAWILVQRYGEPVKA